MYYSYILIHIATMSFTRYYKGPVYVETLCIIEKNCLPISMSWIISLTTVPIFSYKNSFAGETVGSLTS